MNKAFEDDSRYHLFLPNKTVTFTDIIDGKNFEYNIYGVLGVGGSGITYDVADPDIPSKHYALKEFLPEKYSNSFARVNAALDINDDNLTAIWDELVESFLKETDIQRDFPDNNGKFGQYFIYPNRFFKANNTDYILYDTEACITLKDRVAELRNKPYDEKSTPAIELILQYFIDICSAVEVLHSLDDPIFHLDISTNNIMVNSNGHAKLTDFGSAIRKSATSQDCKKALTFSNEFSPIEQKVASSSGKLVAINERTDIYAICAVLYKCLFDQPYNSIMSRIDYSRADKLRDVLPNSALTQDRQAIWRILDIIKNGLCGNEYRYNSVSELKNQLKKLKSYLEKMRDYYSCSTSRKVLIGFAGMALVMLFSLFIVIIFLPTPTISANIDSLYAQGDDITFSVFVTDKEGISNEITYSDFLKNIETVGFDFEKLDFDSKKAEDGSVLELFVTLENISSSKCGKKQIKINDIYQCNKFDTSFNLEKTNKHETYEFELVEENIKCVISEPSVTKVNSGKGHNVTYRVFFKSPVECDIDISTIKRVGFNCESCESKYLGNSTFDITLKNITGTSGNGKHIIIPAAVAVSKDGELYSKETTSPQFEIVDEEVRNDVISLSAFVEEQDLRDGGFIYFELYNYSGQECSNNIDESKITFSGFKADIKVRDNSVFLNNLQIEDLNNVYVVFDEGCLVSRENGSRSDVLVKKIAEINSYADTSIPAVTIGYLGDRQQIKSGGDLVILAAGNDNESCFLNRKSGMFNTNGFTYDKCEITISGLSIRAVYYNIKPTSVDGNASVTLKETTFIDEAGNVSKEKNYRFNIK